MEDEKKIGICRVCLSCDIDSDKGLSLFQIFNDCVISDKINALANIDVKEGDGLPDKICSNCLHDLENAFKFKLKCEKTNQILLSAVNNGPGENLKKLEENLDASMKEEYLTDDDLDYLDDNITLADLQQATQVDLLPLPKLSRAIDLKLECHDCGGSFKSKCKLRVHWKKVHMTENLKCSNCLRKFKSFAAYNSHKKKDLKSCKAAGKVRIEGEGKNRIFHCKDCNYQSKRIKDISAHTVIHSGERPYQCDLCSKVFTQQSSLQSHKEGTHKVYAAEGTCQFCGKHIQGRTKLYRHMKLHSSQVFPCKVCNAKLKTKSSLNQHMKRHSGVKSYSCEICATSFYTGSELYNHKTKVHLKSKIYKCAICNYTSYHSFVIKNHQPKHSGSNVACGTCGKFVDNEQQLALHKKRHTDRNYHCIHCDKTYFSRKNLSSHVRKTHHIVKLINHKNVSRVNSVKSECLVSPYSS